MYTTCIVCVAITAGNASGVLVVLSKGHRGAGRNLSMARIEPVDGREALLTRRFADRIGGAIGFVSAVGEISCRERKVLARLSARLGLCELSDCPLPSASTSAFRNSDRLFWARKQTHSSMRSCDSSRGTRSAVWKPHSYKLNVVSCRESRLGNS